MMLRAANPGSLRALAHRGARFSTSARASSAQPHAPLELDPSLQALMRDVDVSIARHKTRAGGGAEDSAGRKHRELEVYEDSNGTRSMSHEDLDDDSAASRKSPAAAFGSHGIGATVLPVELDNAITRLIEGADKGLLRLDAKRLFTEEPSHDAKSDGKWDPDYDVRYKSRLTATRHAERDGTAFASVALPSHYAAIHSIFDQLTHRLGPSWSVERMIDFHAGTGSGMWAALNAFQRTPPPPGNEPDLSKSSLVTYTGIDNRAGLVAIGKRLMEGVNVGGLSASWQKSWNEEDKIKRTQGGDVLALSAFGISTLSNPIARKQLVKDMWDSGADIIVIVDHNTLEGFGNVAEARQQLLRMGQKEMEDPETADWPVRGSHVVAPCPHDGACPLHHGGTERLVCGFSQRLQRPAFLRRTKHTKVGHEDIGYSYVVVRRGARPPPLVKNAPRLGRLGQVGSRALQREAEKLAEASRPKVLEESVAQATEAVEPGAAVDAGAAEPAAFGPASVDEPKDGVLESLRQEAFRWPRLVFPPLKRSGHIILDVCAPEGKILRMTIPKSQGKQPYYDARKSAWGDIFPHAPKNAPQERYVPPDGKGPVKGSDIGKRGVDVRRQADGTNERTSYRRLNQELKKNKSELRRARKQKWDDSDNSW